MNPAITGNFTAVKYATIVINELYINLIALHYLRRSLTPKRTCKILAWVFFLSALVSDMAYILTAILTQANIQTVSDLVSPWDNVFSLAMYALVFLIFEGDPLINWLKYCVIDCSLSAVVLAANALLMALGFTHDMTTVSTAADLPRYFVIHLLMGLAIWFAIKYALRFMRKLCRSRKLAHSCSLIFLALNIVSFCCGEALAPSSITLPMARSICILFISLLLFCAAAVLFLYWRFSQAALREENANLQHVLTMQYERFRQLEQYQTQLHQQNHDFRHHLTVLKTLLSNGKPEAANDYLDALQASHMQLPVVCYCGNMVVDAALSSKQALAESQNIQIQYHIQLPQALHPSDVDLSCAISNLLDNAIEACAQVTDGPKTITLSAHVASGFLLIVVKNSCRPDPIPFQTAKSGDHGWGLKIMRDIAARNDGTFEITQNGNTVTAILSLSNQQEDPPLRQRQEEGAHSDS